MTTPAGKEYNDFNKEERGGRIMEDNNEEKIVLVDDDIEL